MMLADVTIALPQNPSSWLVLLVGISIISIIVVVVCAVRAGKLDDLGSKGNQGAAYLIMALLLGLLSIILVCFTFSVGVDAYKLSTGTLLKADGSVTPCTGSSRIHCAGCDGLKIESPENSAENSLDN